MNRNAHKKQSADIFTERAHGDVRQDKNAPARALLGSIEPAATTTSAYVRHKPPKKPKRHGSNRRRTVEVYGCVSREVAAEIDRLRNQGSALLSRSSVVAALLKTAIRGQIDMQYGALLTPVIEQAIDNRLKARDARFAALLVRIAYDTAQNRALLTNLLARSPGITPEILEAILDQSGKRAKAKLIRFSPQITELIEIVETWMRDTPEAGSERPTPGQPAK